MASVRPCAEPPDELDGFVDERGGKSPAMCRPYADAPRPLKGSVRRGGNRMLPISKDIIRSSMENSSFRRVIATGEHSQVVLMSIPPGGEIGEETHEDVDQVLVLVAGVGEAVLGGWERIQIRPGSLVFVPAGTKHNFVNKGEADLKLYTVYAPPEHAPDTVHKSRADAEAAADPMTIGSA
jgi:mannose-6-phosphate isomerase-like protein (cupin superfamily)